MESWTVRAQVYRCAVNQRENVTCEVCCAYLLMLLGSLIGVSSVHFCHLCSARFTSFLLSLKLLS